MKVGPLQPIFYKWKAYKNKHYEEQYYINKLDDLDELYINKFLETLPIQDWIIKNQNMKKRISRKYPERDWIAI